MIDRIARSPALFVLALALAATLGAALFAGAQAIAPATIGASDKARIERTVRDYILANPEILPEAMERLRARETGAVIAANRSAILDPYDSAWAGDAKGDVTVVAYMDYACGYCRASLPEIQKLLASDRRVRIVYRELPILSPASRTAAAWSLAAAEQGKFQRFHDALYAQGQLTEAGIARAAAAAGLDRARAEAAVRSPRVEAELARNMDVAGKLGMTGTPTWVIGDKVLSGVLALDGFAEAVKAARTAS